MKDKRSAHRMVAFTLAAAHLFFAVLTGCGKNDNDQTNTNSSASLPASQISDNAENNSADENSDNENDNKDADYSLGKIVASGKCGENAEWELDENGLLVISGSGGVEGYEPDVPYEKAHRPWNTNEVKKVVIKRGITGIEDGTFEQSDNLISVIIPDSVTSIGIDAFCQCENLTSITIPDSVTDIGVGAFQFTAWYNAQPDGIVYAGKVAYNYKGDMPSDTDIVIKDGTKGIAGFAFHDCENLRSITIPDSVIKIGKNALTRCHSLSSISISQDNPEYIMSDGILFNKNKTELIVWPNTVIGPHYNIPESVTSIGDYAFAGCVSLESITLPESLVSIGNWSFSNCRELKEIIIPDSVTDIGECAFEGCVNLTNIKLSNNITVIKDGTFVNCGSIKNITIPDGVTRICNAFMGHGERLESIIIPESVTYIYEDLFLFFENLTIYGKSGSYAETYATEHHIPFEADDAPEDHSGGSTDVQYIRDVMSKVPFDIKSFKVVFDDEHTVAEVEAVFKRFEIFLQFKELIHKEGRFEISDSIVVQESDDGYIVQFTMISAE